MSQNVLQFQCTSCHAVLTVPVTMAGVTGPCPKCGVTITSPSAPPLQQGNLSIPSVPEVQPTAPPARPQVQAPPAAPQPVAQPTPPQAIWNQPAAPVPVPAQAPTQPPAGPAWGAAPEAGRTALPPRSAPRGTLENRPAENRPAEVNTPASLSGIPSAASGSLPPRRLPERNAASGSLLRSVTGTTGMLRSQAPAFGGIPTAPATSAPSGPEAPPQPAAVREDPVADLLRGGNSAEPNGPSTAGAGQTPGLAFGGSPSPFPPHLNIRLGDEKKSGGRWVSALVILAILGGLGYAGWHFSEPIKQIALRYFPVGSSEETPVPVPTEEPSTVLKAEPAGDPTTFNPGEKSAPVPTPVPVPTPAGPDVPKAQPITPEVAAMTSQTPPTPAPGGGIVEVKPGQPVDAPSTPNTFTKSPPDTDVVVKADAQAQPAAKALLAFFAAPNLTERLKYTLGAASVQSLMTRYYEKMADGVIDVSEISLLRFDETPQTGGGAHCVFTVSSKLWEFPIPVMLQEEGGSFKVDWLAFVEFRDNLLYKFLSAYQDEPARFHVGIRRTHYFENDVPDLDGKDCFEIQPPLPTYVGFVFVPKNSPLATDLAGRISWETSKAYVIVELRWRKLGDQKWVELTGVPQLNWYSFPLDSKPTAPKAKPAGQK